MVKTGAIFILGEYKIIIAGGGTGGHLFPAIAIGEEIKERIPNAKIHFVGSNFGLEAKVYPIKDLLHTLLPIRGLQRGFSIDSFLKNEKEIAAVSLLTPIPNRYNTIKKIIKNKIPIICEKPLLASIEE